MQCASTCTGVKRVDVTTPPNSPSRHTDQLRIPAAARRSQKLTNSLSVFGAKSSATCRRDCSIQPHTRGSAYTGNGAFTVTPTLVNCRLIHLLQMPAAVVPPSARTFLLAWCDRIGACAQDEPAALIQFVRRIALLNISDTATELETLAERLGWEKTAYDALGYRIETGHPAL